jgi:hypothetical protein
MSTQLVRAVAPYEPRGGRFLIINKDFSKQYSNLYVARMKAMKPGLVELAKREWKNVQLAQKIIDTEDNLQEMRDEVALVGVLYKEMGLRSSVLDEFKESGGISLGAGEKLDSLVSEVGLSFPLPLTSTFSFLTMIIIKTHTNHRTTY